MVGLLAGVGLLGLVAAGFAADEGRLTLLAFAAWICVASSRAWLTELI